MKITALVPSIFLLAPAAPLLAQDSITIPWAVGRERLPTIETCAEFQDLRTEDSDAAIRYAWTLAAGYVKGLERGGIIDDLLPIPPRIQESPD